jgi:hypothetical protein
VGGWVGGWVWPALLVPHSLTLSHLHMPPFALLARALSIPSTET